jgi:hypothetical protein
MKPNFPEQEQLKCPRCVSANTKFCYYNNYNLSQPRHFCKNCRRYWTKGGVLRNIPIGGGTRKNTKQESNPKRSSSSSTASNLAVQNPPLEPDPTRMYGAATAADQECWMLDVTKSFSSLLASNGQFGSFLEGLNPIGSEVKMVQIDEFVEFSESLLKENNKTKGKYVFFGLTYVFENGLIKLIKLYSTISLYSTNTIPVTEQGLSEFLLKFRELFFSK